MEITKLVKPNAYESMRDMADDNAALFAEIRNILRELLLYNARYGISVDSVNVNEGVNAEICITVPEHSELKSERDFEMCGIYLANQFKTVITDAIEKLNNLEPELSEIPRAKIKYSSVIGSILKEEESNTNLHNLTEEMYDNIYYPFAPTVRIKIN